MVGNTKELIYNLFGDSQRIPTSGLFGGPLGCFANEMVATGSGAYPISEGRPMPTFVYRKGEKGSKPDTPGAKPGDYSGGKEPGMPYISARPVSGPAKEPNTKKSNGNAKKGVKKVPVDLGKPFKEIGKKIGDFGKPKKKAMPGQPERKYTMQKVKEEIDLLREQTGKLSTSEKEILYSGTHLNEEIRNKTYSLGREIKYLSGVLNDDKERFGRTAKVGNKKFELTKKNTRNSASGKYVAEAQDGAAEFIPTAEEEYRSILSNMTTTKETTSRILQELTDMWDAVTFQMERYAKAQTDIRDAWGTYDEQLTSLSGMKTLEEMGKESPLYKKLEEIGKDVSEGKELEKAYKDLYESMETTEAFLGEYAFKARGLIDRIERMEPAVDRKLNDINSYNIEQAS